MSVLNNVINVPNYTIDTSVWTSYTSVITAVVTNPTPGSGYVFTNYYLQMGKLLFIQMYFAQPNAGTSGNGLYLFSLPSGFTVNTSVAPNYSATSAFCLGSAQTSISGAGGVGGAMTYNSTNYCLYGSDEFGDIAFLGSGAFADLSNAGSNYSAALIVPIN